MIALVGFMGAGKSTVGRLLARRLGLPFVDVDEAVERRAGAPVAAVFERGGESAFRALERDVTREALAGPDAVVALGGGGPEDPAVREALAGVTTVHLDVPLEEALARVAGDGPRPMLERADPAALFARRGRVYEAVATFSVATRGRSPAAVADEIAARAGAAPRRVPVVTPSGRYDAVVGRGLAARVAEWAPPGPDAEVAFVVTEPGLRAAAEPAARSLAEAGLEVAWGVVPQGEDAKSLAVAEGLFAGMAEAGLHRHDLVVGFGGGAVCDVAGFVASTYHRGVAVVHVPTTLLAQVDAAIGGKTGVNLPQGKNLVGTFHQPRAVVCDVDLLRSLPRAELRAGMAEVVKYGLIADPALLDVAVSDADAIVAAEPDVLVSVVERSVAIKAEVVGADEREQGRRAHLNYGHTFGHAIEAASGFTGIRHGEAVALGMMAAAHLARELGRVDDEVVEVHRRTLEALGLPVRARCDLGVLEAAWRHDKKYRRGVRFVLLSALARPEAGVRAPRAAVARALERLAG